MPVEATITDNTRVQLGVMIALISALVCLTAYVVTIKNNQDVHERRITAGEIRDEKYEERQTDQGNILSRVETKLDIILQIKGYTSDPPN